MPKPACIPCQRFFRPKKNGYMLLEQKPSGGVRSLPGTQAPDTWEPYKVWACDMWECEGCGAQIASGYSSQPLSQDYLPDFQEWVNTCASVINDC